MAEAKTASRFADQLGSRDLTTASTSRGRLGNRIIGFCLRTLIYVRPVGQWKGMNCEFEERTFLIINAMSCIVELRSTIDEASMMSTEIAEMNRGVWLPAMCRTPVLAICVKFRKESLSFS
jgi:hypothetical protein